jgi:hypothetical protein
LCGHDRTVELVVAVGKVVTVTGSQGVEVSKL